MSAGKKHTQAKATIDRMKAYPLEEALAQVKEVSYAKFDETVDVSIRLGVDPRKADQMVRGAVVLPNGLGKTVRVLVFAKGEKAAEATAAGADFVGADDLVAKIQGGWFDFDTAIATPDMMGTVGKIGKLRITSYNVCYTKLLRDIHALLFYGNAVERTDGVEREPAEFFQEKH